MDPDIKALIQTLLEGQIRTDKMIGELGALVAKFVDTSSAYVQASDARMKRLEENLDGLIRAITREHTNGKGNQ